MHSAILMLTTGDPDGNELPQRLDDNLPAASASRTEYLDGNTIHHGTLAGRVSTTETVPVIGEDDIYTDREEGEETVVGDYYTDLKSGWAGITTSDAEALLVDYLASSAGIIPEDAAINLDAFAERLPDDVETNGIVYSQSVDDGHSRDASGSHWKQDAQPSKIPSEGTSVLHVQYEWDGVYVDANLAASGYVAVYKDWTPELFARWLAQEVQPHLHYAGNEQATLDDTDDSEVCENCGREPEYALEETRDGQLVCLVCKDDIDNRSEA